VRPGPAILATLAPRDATGDLFAFGVARLDGVSVPF